MAPSGGDCSRGDVVRAGRCHLGGSEGGHWPTNAGSAGGLGGALLGGWAEPATCSCGGLVTLSGSHLATPPILTTHPCPAVPLDASGQPLAGLGCCCSSATCDCPSSHPTPCWVMLVGKPAKWLEAPKLRWPRTGGGLVKMGWQVHYCDTK